MVETSVAVATPRTTAVRMTKGSSSAGSATTRVRRICVPEALAPTASPRERRQATRPRARASTRPGTRPPVNRAEMETPVTEPMVMSTKLGGMVSLMAPEAERMAISSPSAAPRCFISGNSTGATAAMSAALEPEMPETRYIAPSRT